LKEGFGGGDYTKFENSLEGVFLFGSDGEERNGDAGFESCWCPRPERSERITAESQAIAPDGRAGRTARSRSGTDD